MSDYGRRYIDQLLADRCGQVVASRIKGQSELWLTTSPDFSGSREAAEWLMTETWFRLDKLAEVNGFADVYGLVGSKVERDLAALEAEGREDTPAGGYIFKVARSVLGDYLRERGQERRLEDAWHGDPLEDYGAGRARKSYSDTPAEWVKRTTGRTFEEWGLAPEDYPDATGRHGIKAASAYHAGRPSAQGTAAGAERQRKAGQEVSDDNRFAQNRDKRDKRKRREAARR